MQSWMIFAGIFIVMMFVQFGVIRFQQNKAKYLTQLLNSVNNEEKFYAVANEAEEKEKRKEFLEKCRVIRLWADSYYQKDEDFKEYIEKVDIPSLLDKKGTIKGNEDAFFYFYLNIPHFLYMNGKEELIALLNEKMSAIPAEGTLLKAISDANVKFYKKEDDLGKEFYETVLNGNYEDYSYNKELIGLYKNIITVMLSVIYKNENNEEKYNDLVEYMRNFAKIPMGERWLKSLNIELPEPVEEPEENEEDSENKTEEATEENKEETTEEEKPEEDKE